MRKKILIIRQDRLGDVVLATALPRELKRRYPGCHITMLVRPYTCDVFDHNPHVDNVLIDDVNDDNRGETFWPMVAKVRREHFTHALMLLPEARYNYMTFAAGIPFRLGHGIILFHALTLVRPVMTRKLQKGRNEAEYAMDLARAVGVKTTNIQSEIYLSAEEKRECAEIRKQWQGGDPERRIIGIHSTSGKSSPNWEPDVWAELIANLTAAGSVQVVVTDYEVPAEIEHLPNVEIMSVPGGSLRRDIVHFAALDLLVSASTGPMHVAAALKVPTLSVFCPLPACEPALWGPNGNRAEYVLPDPAYCRDHCPGDPHICSFSGDCGFSPASISQMILTR